MEFSLGGCYIRALVATAVAIVISVVVERISKKARHN